VTDGGNYVDHIDRCGVRAMEVADSIYCVHGCFFWLVIGHL